MSLADLTYDSFAPYEGTGFAISSEGYDDVLTLTRVQRGTVIHSAREAFNLTLRSTRTDIMYNSGLFLLRHPAMGELELFINPVGRNEDGTVDYEVPFN